MAQWSLTDASSTAEIDDNPLLAAMAFSAFGNFVKWSDPNLTYTLNVGDSNPEGEQTGVWTQALTQAIETAHADVSAVSMVRFTEISDAVNGTDGADIDYWAYSSPGDNIAGFSYGVGGQGVFIDVADVYEPDANTGDGLMYGGINYRTVIHELLHNLGLAHPFDGYAVLPGVSSVRDTGDFALNQNLYTVLSYNSVRQVDANGVETTGYPFTFSTVDRSFGVLGTLDIAMLQALYGANMTHALGDDVYVLPEANESGTYYKAIWDAGGTDEFRYNGAADATIDLRAATLDIADGMLAGGMLSKANGIYGGFNIANGTVIENATGGGGNDSLVGNAFANHLSGRGGTDTLLGGDGDDTLSGGAGADTLDGGEGSDTLDLSGSQSGVSVDFLLEIGLGGDADGDVYHDLEAVVGSNAADVIYGDDGGNRVVGNGGDDVIRTARGEDTIEGNAGHDTLYGGQGADLILGGGDDDWINGGGSGDMLDGGEGFDWVDFSASFDQVVVDLEQQSASGGDATGDTLRGFEAVRGSSYGDRLTGDGGNNTLDGANGRDVLDGGAGDDLLIGGNGRDTFIFSSGNDILQGGAGEDQLLLGLISDLFDITDLGNSNWTLVHVPAGETTTVESVEMLVFEDIVMF